MILRWLMAPFRVVSILFLLISLVLILITLYLTVSSESKRKQAMQNSKAYICRLLLCCINIRVRRIGVANEEAKLWVANHISWLDVLMFTDRAKTHFIAKSEVRHWPVVGLVTRLLDTVFINRHNKFLVYRSLPKAQHVIKQQETLFVFPEGTTGHGNKTSQIYPMMFELAVREKCWVQPIAIRYWNHNNQPSEAAPFVDDDGIIGNIFKLALQRFTLAEVHYLTPLDGSSMTRKEMAAATQRAINDVLKQPHPNTQPATSAAMLKTLIH